MDLSDDVAYSVHDLEDGVVARSIDLTSLRDPDVRRAVWATVRDWYLPAAADEELEQVFGELLAMASWPGSPYDGSRRALAALKNLTSDLIGRFCGEVQRATHERYGIGPLTRYAADLIVPRPTGLAIAALAITFLLITTAVSVMPVERPFYRYSLEFLSRVTLATYPAVVIWAALGAVEAWRRSGHTRVCGILFVAAAVIVAGEAWLGWIR